MHYTSTLLDRAIQRQNNNYEKWRFGRQTSNVTWLWPLHVEQQPNPHATSSVGSNGIVIDCIDAILAVVPLICAPRGPNQNRTPLRTCHIWSKWGLFGVLGDVILHDVHYKHVKMLAMGWYNNLVGFWKIVLHPYTVYQANTVQKWHNRKIAAREGNMDTIVATTRRDHV